MALWWPSLSCSNSDSSFRPFPNNFALQLNLKTQLHRRFDHKLSTLFENYKVKVVFGYIFFFGKWEKWVGKHVWNSFPYLKSNSKLNFIIKLNNYSQKKWIILVASFVLEMEYSCQNVQPINTVDQKWRLFTHS